VTWEWKRAPGSGAGALTVEFVPSVILHKLIAHDPERTSKRRARGNNTTKRRGKRGEERWKGETRGKRGEGIGDRG
jgi:hypothetical protein